MDALLKNTQTLNLVFNSEPYRVKGVITDRIGPYAIKKIVAPLEPVNGYRMAASRSRRKRFKVFAKVKHNPIRISSVTTYRIVGNGFLTNGAREVLAFPSRKAALDYIERSVKAFS